MGKQGPQDANVARACDLNHVRSKPSNQGRHLSIVPQEQKVELMSLIQRETHPAPPELYPGDRLSPHNFISRTCVDDQEGEFMALCKSLELPASVSESVYFAVCIREKDNSCTFVLHKYLRELLRAVLV